MTETAFGFSVSEELSFKSSDEEFSENAIALDLILPWVNCNVYTKSKTTVLKKLKAHTAKYLHLKGYPKSKRKKLTGIHLKTFLLNVKKYLISKGPQKK